VRTVHEFATFLNKPMVPALIVRAYEVLLSGVDRAYRL
jgi:hypothetical protein